MAFPHRGGAPPEPILRDFKTIKVMDAVLAWDGRELARDEHGKPLERTDGEGNRVEVLRYRNPKRPEWPEADFIVGNPPFIGSKYLRERLGDGYVEALWAAHPHMNESADFVMYWWDRAAELLTRQGRALTALWPRHHQFTHPSVSTPRFGMTFQSEDRQSRCSWRSPTIRGRKPPREPQPCALR